MRIWPIFFAGCLALCGGCSGGPEAVPTRDNGLRTTEDITYRPEAIVVPAERAQSIILERSDDDSSFLLDGSAPELADLSPGRVLLLGGVTLRKVTSVTRENGQLRVATEEAALTDAIARGHLGWNGTLDWKAVSTLQTNLPGSGVHVQSAHPWSEEISTKVEVFPWSYGFKASKKDNKLNIDVDIIRKTAAAWMKVHAELDRPDLDGNIYIDDNLAVKAQFAMRNLHGKVSAEWGVGIRNDAALSIDDILWGPVDVAVPILGIVPLFFRASINFGFVAALVGRGTATSGTFDWEFGGSSNLEGDGHAEPAGSGDGSSHATLGNGGDFQAIAGSAIGLVVNAPRFAISLGVPKVTEVMYFWGIISELDARASGPSTLVPCKAFDLTIKMVHGFEGRFLGWTSKKSQDLGMTSKTSWSVPQGATCK
jgi:hypothetical protein